jgi:tetratricopeptide (TPR) repeat protein
LLGDIEATKKRYKSARTHYTKAIKLNDGFFYNHLMRGQVNEKLKASKAAKQDLQKSIELLPTANAYTLLENIAKREGDLADAKSYYAKAASNKTSQGKLAYRSLMEIDLQDNPQKYIKLRSGLDKDGRLKAEISNPTPADVKNLAVTVRYRDTSGAIKSVRRSFRGELKAGEKRLVDLGFAKLDRSQLANIEASVSEASLSR